MTLLENKVTAELLINLLRERELGFGVHSFNLWENDKLSLIKLRDNEVENFSFNIEQDQKLCMNKIYRKFTLHLEDGSNREIKDCWVISDARLKDYF